MNTFLRSQNEPLLPDFRLPTETEWEYALEVVWGCLHILGEDLTLEI